MTLARDVMETDVVTIEQDTPLLSVYRLFYDEGISGVPVVDKDGQVVGVVSATDLIRTVREDHESHQTAAFYYRDARVDARPDWLTEVEEFEDGLELRSVADVMTAEVVAVAPEDPISVVAKKILDYRIHRVLVLDDESATNQLLGIISLFDLVRLLA